jgi:hypothetical protein
VKSFRLLCINDGVRGKGFNTENSVVAVRKKKHDLVLVLGGCGGDTGLYPGEKTKRRFVGYSNNRASRRLLLCVSTEGDEEYEKQKKNKAGADMDAGSA